jgi:hypothetical protein
MDNFLKFLNSVNSSLMSELFAANTLDKKRQIDNRLVRVALKFVYGANAFPADMSLKNIILDLWNDVILNADRSYTNKQWAELFKKMDQFIKILYPNENTSERLFTLLRKPIKQMYGDTSEIYKRSLYDMGISQARSIQKKQEYREKVATTGMRRDELPEYTPDNIYKLIDDNIKSETPLKKLIAIILASGSRFIEILTSDYSKVRGEPMKIKINNMAKGNKSIIRPLIRINATKVMNAIKSIRENLDLSGDKVQISDRYNSQTNKLLKQIDPALKTHTLRKLAGNLAYQLYGNNANPTIWLQSYFGHSEPSTTLTYENVNVVREETRAPELVQNVDYPQFLNKKKRNYEPQRIQLLTEFYRFMRNNNINIPYKDIKGKYGYSSRTLSKFKELVDNGDIVVV